LSSQTNRLKNLVFTASLLDVPHYRDTVKFSRQARYFAKFNCAALAATAVLTANI